jgi:hypothetical protein
MDLLDYNDYTTDPISNNDSCAAIACRVDLEADVTIREPYGAIDMKVSSLGRMKSSGNPEERSETFTKLGPTHARQAPFCWSEYEAEPSNTHTFVHLGHPDCFTGSWQRMPPLA